MKSGPRELNWLDVYKGMKAGVYNLLSLTAAISAFLISLPKEQVPDWLWGVVAISPLINGFAVIIIQWYRDNRYRG